MNEEEAVIVSDQLSVVESWLRFMRECDEKETLSYGEIAEVQAVYNLVKDAIY